MIRAIVVAFSMVLMMVTVCWGQHLDIKRDHQRVIHPTIRPRLNVSLTIILSS